MSTRFVERQKLDYAHVYAPVYLSYTRFSKKLDTLKAAVDFHFFYYNFVRIHKTIRVTPAMEAGVSNHL